MVRNSDLAQDPRCEEELHGAVAGSAFGASPQLRNMATTGGNLLQRTRCAYFREPNYACNKRTPGSGCAALEGFHRTHAILGTSEHCIATHPSDMCVAMVALEATIQVEGAEGQAIVRLRISPAARRHAAHRERAEPGELITYVDLPSLPEGAKVGLPEAARSRQLRVCAGVGGSGRESGGGHIATCAWPWAVWAPSRGVRIEAERALTGRRCSAHTFRTAAEAALKRPSRAPTMPSKLN